MKDILFIIANPSAFVNILQTVDFLQEFYRSIAKK